MDDLEFIEEGHLYIKSGVIIPSVSEILHFIFPDKYKGIDQDILNKKATYGSTVHESIEYFEQKKDLPELDNNQRFSLTQYIRLKAKNKIEVISQEQMIYYKEYYAGRYDMVAKVNDCLCLCDIKTTAQLDKEYLSWQLSFYELASNYLLGTSPYEKLYAIWLPKGKYGELVEIERKPTSELLRVLKEFKESRKNYV